MRIFYIYLSALSFFAGSGSGTNIPDSDPGKTSGSMRTRNTGFNTQQEILCYLFLQSQTPAILVV